MNYKSLTVAFVVLTLMLANTNLYSQGFLGAFESLFNNEIESNTQISLNYGVGDFSRTGLTGPVSSLNIYGGTIGIGTKLIKGKVGNSFLGLYAKSVTTNGEPNSSVTYKDVGLGETTSFTYSSYGFENWGGTGYSLGNNTGVILSTGSSWGWSKISPKSYASTDTNNWQSIADFPGDVRWTRSWSPGIEITTDYNVGIRLGYSWTQMFPRFMTWYEIGSSLIQTTSEIALVYVKREIIEEDNKYYPVVHFLLTNGLQYLLYNLKTDNISWPFDTAPPLNIKSWNISVNYAF